MYVLASLASVEKNRLPLTDLALSLVWWSILRHHLLEFSLAWAESHFSDIQEGEVGRLNVRVRLQPLNCGMRVVADKNQRCVGKPFRAFFEKLLEVNSVVFSFIARMTNQVTLVWHSKDCGHVGALSSIPRFRRWRLLLLQLSFQKLAVLWKSAARFCVDLKHRVFLTLSCSSNDACGW